MIDKQLAEDVKAVVLDCARQLDQSVKLAFQGAPERQASLYRTFAGRVMGLLFTEVLRPIYAAFPELEPEELRRARTGEREYIPAEVGVKLLEVNSSVVRSLSELKEELIAKGDKGSRLVQGLDEAAEPLITMKEYLYRACPGIADSEID